MRNADELEFAQRVRRQIQSGYRGKSVDVIDERFALRVTAPGIDVALPLAPLFHACQRSKEGTPTLIAEFVRSAERHLTPTQRHGLALSQLIWCVRSRRYLDSVARADELAIRELGGDIVAFVAETLPGPSMRGVPASAWHEEGLDIADVEKVADANTAQRFSSLLERVANIDRVPDDGWRIATDELFCGSLMLVHGIRNALVEKAGGDVLIASPDRGLVLALAHNAAGANRFGMRVVREWREAMNPCSRQVLVTDGDNLEAAEANPKKRQTYSWL